MTVSEIGRKLDHCDGSADSSKLGGKLNASAAFQTAATAPNRESRRKSFKKATKRVLSRATHASIKSHGGRTIHRLSNYPSCLACYCAVFCPPIGVAIHRDCNAEVAIALLLWLLGVIPGIVYALVLVTTVPPNTGLSTVIA